MKIKNKTHDGVVKVVTSVGIVPDYSTCVGFPVGFVTDVGINVKREMVPSLSRVKDLENRVHVLTKNNEALTKDLNKLKNSLVAKLDEIRKIVESERKSKGCRCE